MFRSERLKVSRNSNQNINFPLSFMWMTKILIPREYDIQIRFNRNLQINWIWIRRITGLKDMYEDVDKILLVPDPKLDIYNM